MARRLINSTTQPVFDKAGKQLGTLITNDFVDDKTAPAQARAATSPAPAPTRPAAPSRPQSPAVQYGNALAKSRGIPGCSGCGLWNCTCPVPAPPSGAQVVELQRARGMRR